MKFKTFDFEGTKILSGLDENLVVALETGGMYRLLGYKSEADLRDATLRTPSAMYECGIKGCSEKHVFTGVHPDEAYQMAVSRWNDAAKVRRFGSFLRNEVLAWRDDNYGDILAERCAVGREKFSENKATRNEGVSAEHAELRREIRGLHAELRLAQEMADFLSDKLGEAYAAAGN